MDIMDDIQHLTGVKMIFSVMDLSSIMLLNPRAWALCFNLPLVGFNLNPILNQGKLDHNAFVWHDIQIFIDNHEHLISIDMAFGRGGVWLYRPYSPMMEWYIQPLSRVQCILLFYVIINALRFKLTFNFLVWKIKVFISLLFFLISYKKMHSRATKKNDFCITQYSKRVPPLNKMD